MQAIVYDEYGAPDVLHLKEMAKPVPAANEVLVRVRATSVNYGDLTARKFSKLAPRDFNMPLLFWFMARLQFGYSRPKNGILGSEFAGEVAAVGAEVQRFQIGDQVFGYVGARMGANAEYLCVPADGEIALKPANMSFAEAAAIPYGAITAASLLGNANIQPGQKVLIVGASGSIGSAALQLARYYGAEVTGVCGTPRVAMVRALGAHKVIDYNKTSYMASGETYDLIFDVLGKSTFFNSRHLLKPNGRLLLVSFKAKHLLQMLGTALFSRQKVRCVLAPENSGQLPFIKELVAAGHFKAVVDKRFPLQQAAEAHRYLEAGQRQGQVVLALAPA